VIVTQTLICVLYFLFNCMLVLFSHFGYNEINIHTYIQIAGIMVKSCMAASISQNKAINALLLLYANVRCITGWPLQLSYFAWPQSVRGSVRIR